MTELRLIWVRHGEAGQSQAGDKERPLTQRGHQQARSLAQQLQTLGWLPQSIFCSAARRTTETMQTLLQTWSQPLPYSLEHNFYLGNLNNVQTILAQHNLTAYHTLLLLGHNPGWSSAPQILSGTPVNLAPADAALLSIEADDWNTALQTTFSWTLHQVIRPVV